MKPRRYFEKFPETPVILHAYDPATEVLAHEYAQKLSVLLDAFNVDIQHYGSGALKIAGKGELEFALYPSDEHDWDSIITVLTHKFGAPITRKPERIRFGTEYKNVPVEIDLKKGAAALESKETMRRLSDPQVLREYEKVKLKSAYSEREYSYNKKKFFSDLLGEAVED